MNCFFKKYFQRVFSIFLSVLTILCLVSTSLQAETKKSVDDEISELLPDIVYSFYHERYLENMISGVVVSGHNKNRKSWFSSSLLVGAKFGVLQSGQENNNSVGFPAIDLGFGVSYGRNLYVYSDIGFDAGEMIATVIVNIMADDESDKRPIANIDKFATVGIGVRMKSISISTYAKLNKITGVTVRNNTAIYYGLKITYFH